MAKKIGKALLITSAIGLAAAAAYMYFKKQNERYFDDMDEDFDDTFEDDTDLDESRSYVELPKESAPAPAEEDKIAPSDEAPVEEDEIVPSGEAPAEEAAPSEVQDAVSEEVPASEEVIANSVEEFFNEDAEEKN